MDRTGKIKNSFMRLPFIFLWTGAFLLGTALILFPLIFLFSKITPADIVHVLSAARFKKVIINTFWECICSTTLSVITGYVFAYAIVFGRFPLKRFFASVPVLHLVTPPFVGGLAFILLLGRQGLITKTLLHLDVSLYGFPGLLIAQVLCFFPLSYLMCKESFEGLNKNLIEGAVSLGASKGKIFLKVIFPLSFPAFASSFLFTAVSVLSDFGNPMIVGGRYKVLAVEIYTQLTGWMNAGVSSVLGLVLLIPSLILFFLQNYLFKKQTKKTALLGGKGSLSQKNKQKIEPVFKNSPLVDGLLFVFVLFVSFAVLLQFVSIIIGSFQKLWSVDASWTLDHIKKTFNYGKDFANTISFSLLAATLSVLFASFISFCVHRCSLSPLWGKRFLETVIQLPSAVPGSLFGLALSVQANTMHFRAPRFWIIVAITIAFMPFSYRIVTSTFAQIKQTLDEGAMSLGAGPLKIFSQIILPLARGGVAGGWTYNFARGAGTLSSVIFLVSFNTPLCSVRIINLAEQGDWGRAAALAMELTIICFVLILAGNMIIKGANDGK